MWCTLRIWPTLIPVLEAISLRHYLRIRTLCDHHSQSSVTALRWFWTMLQEWGFCIAHRFTRMPNWVEVIRHIRRMCQCTACNCLSILSPLQSLHRYPSTFPLVLLTKAGRAYFILPYWMLLDSCRDPGQPNERIKIKRKDRTHLSGGKQDLRKLVKG